MPHGAFRSGCGPKLPLQLAIKCVIECELPVLTSRRNRPVQREANGPDETAVLDFCAHLAGREIEALDLCADAHREYRPRRGESHTAYSYVPLAWGRGEDARRTNRHQAGNADDRDRIFVAKRNSRSILRIGHRVNAPSNQRAPELARLASRRIASDDVPYATRHKHRAVGGRKCQGSGPGVDVGPGTGPRERASQVASRSVVDREYIVFGAHGEKSSIAGERHDHDLPNTAVSAARNDPHSPQPRPALVEARAARIVVLIDERQCVVQQRLGQRG